LAQLIENTDRSTVELAGRLVIKSTSNVQPSTVKLRHSFDLCVSFPNRVLKLLGPLFKRCVAEVRMEERSWADWRDAICDATSCPLYRSWLASVSWFDYGNDSADNELTQLITPLPPGWDGDDRELAHLLERIGYPTPKDRVKQLPVAKKAIRNALARLGKIRVKVSN
jgi:hypothetical protein